MQNKEEHEMKPITMAALTMMIAGLTLTVALAADGGQGGTAGLGKPQTTCPVMGGAIDPKLYVDALGKRIYMCCAGCTAKIKKDPAKYIAKLEGQGVRLDPGGKPQTTCPVMGGKVDPKIYADVLGRRVYVCCRMCVGTIKKDPAKYISKLEAEGVLVAFGGKPQTTCPVMGGKINPKLYVDALGKRIYICCPGCVAAIKKDPATYIAKLWASGVKVSAVPEAK